VCLWLLEALTGTQPRLRAAEPHKEGEQKETNTNYKLKFIHFELVLIANKVKNQA